MALWYVTEWSFLDAGEMGWLELLVAHWCGGCQIKEEMGGDSLLEFVTEEYSQQAQAAYDMLCVQMLTLENVWDVFQVLLPLISD